MQDGRTDMQVRIYISTYDDEECRGGSDTWSEGDGECERQKASDDRSTSDILL